MSRTYVFGHKNPDTDSVVGSIVYSSFLKSTGTDAVPCKLGSINNETDFVLKTFGQQIPRTITRDMLSSDDSVVLIDHNEQSQTIDGIEHMKIAEIIDHHKFGLATKEPVRITVRPLGSACTIIAQMLMKSGYDISEQHASLLISGIISDTLYFRSPTTTDTDRSVCEELNRIARIDDLEKFSLEMFDAKSDLGDIPASDLVRLDYKVFEFAGNRYGIGVMETTNPDYALSRQDDIISAMKKIKESDSLKGIFFSVIDILNENNITLFSDPEDKALIEKVFGRKAHESMIELGSIVSRKKQIVPAFERYFN